MGALVALESLSAAGQGAWSRPQVDELILAAPDVDVDLFEMHIRKSRFVAGGMTLYASSKDRALVASRRAARKPRAGDVFESGPLIIEKLDSIDVSEIGDEMFGLNHNTFATNRSLIDDVGRLMLHGERPPHRRSPQIRCVPEGARIPRYWRYSA
jgi:esterase/lipase superfamily enzyme